MQSKRGLYGQRLDNRLYMCIVFLLERTIWILNHPKSVITTFGFRMAVRFWAPTVYIKKSLKTIKCSHLGADYFVNSEKSEAKVPCLCITDVEGSLHHRGGKGKKKKKKENAFCFIISCSCLFMIGNCHQKKLFFYIRSFLSFFLSFFLSIIVWLILPQSLCFIPSMSFLQKLTHIVSMIYRELYVFL